jgi:acyl carrier protein
MTTPGTDVDPALRERVVDAMSALLTRLLELDQPVTEDMHMSDELGLSSSLALELLLELEEQLTIQIDVEKLNPDKLLTVGELATFISGNSRSW